LRHLVRLRWRTYDVLAVRLRKPAGFLVGAAGVNLDEGLGLMATQTLIFLFADIEGLAAMGRRLGGAYERGLADHHRLIRAGLAAHGG
jgi:class 3 adenylate cyclase